METRAGGVPPPPRRMDGVLVLPVVVPTPAVVVSPPADAREMWRPGEKVRPGEEEKFVVVDVRSADTGTAVLGVSGVVSWALVVGEESGKLEVVLKLFPEFGVARALVE